jgi:hypothetical protein
LVAAAPVGIEDVVLGAVHPDPPLLSRTAVSPHGGTGVM